MKKNVYSLVLSEGVIDAVDRAAYREGCSRSALINRILAEYVSYTTPEMRMREIFEGASIRLTRLSFRPSARSDSMLSVSSSLEYKYNPTVKYSLELYRNSDALGELRVSVRTQNRALLLLADRFFRAFMQTESRYIGAVRYGLSEGRFTRVIALPENTALVLTGEDIGALVAAYVSMLDESLKAYFAYAADEVSALRAVDAVYRRYLSETSVPV